MSAHNKQSSASAYSADRPVFVISVAAELEALGVQAALHARAAAELKARNSKARKEKLEEFAQSIRQKFDELAQKFK